MLSHNEHEPLIQAGDKHFPFPPRVQAGARHCPSLPIPSPLQEGQGVQGILGFAVLPRQRAGAAWCHHGTKDLLPQGHRVSRGCHFSREGKFTAGRGKFSPERQQSRDNQR